MIVYFMIYMTMIISTLNIQKIQLIDNFTEEEHDKYEEEVITIGFYNYIFQMINYYNPNGYHIVEKYQIKELKINNYKKKDVDPNVYQLLKEIL